MKMVLVLPSEFSAPGGQTGGLDDDVAEEQLGQRPKTKEELLAVAFNEVIPREEPNKYRHLKPLYISAHVEGVPISKVFVDCGATVNILPCSLMRKLAKTREDLIPSDVIMGSFVGDKSKTIVVLPLKITVADQTRITAFYVVESSVDYNILLGRDWIHQAGCIPSSLFQLLFFWDGQRVSIHPADKKPFETSAVQARIYDDDVGWVVLIGHDANDRPTWTTAQKVLELGAENAWQDSALVSTMSLLANVPAGVPKVLKAAILVWSATVISSGSTPMVLDLSPTKLLMTTSLGIRSSLVLASFPISEQGRMLTVAPQSMQTLDIGTPSTWAEIYNGLTCRYLFGSSLGITSLKAMANNSSFVFGLWPSCSSATSLSRPPVWPPGAENSDGSTKTKFMRVVARVMLPTPPGIWIFRPGVPVLVPAEPVSSFSATGFLSAAGRFPPCCTRYQRSSRTTGGLNVLSGLRVASLLLPAEVLGPCAPNRSNTQPRVGRRSFWPSKRFKVDARPKILWSKSHVAPRSDTPFNEVVPLSTTANPLGQEAFNAQGQKGRRWPRFVEIYGGHTTILHDPKCRLDYLLAPIRLHQADIFRRSFQPRMALQDSSYKY
ncbi:unnamed protein product [Prunus brigantina]